MAKNKSFLGTLWYTYKKLRGFEQTRYLRCDRPRRIDDPVDPWHLRQIRLGADNPNFDGFSYKNLGDETFVDEWIDYGLQQQFYTHNWLDEIDQLLLFTRQEANEAILEFYPDQ